MINVIETLAVEINNSPEDAELKLFPLHNVEITCFDLVPTSR